MKEKKLSKDNFPRGDKNEFSHFFHGNVLDVCSFKFDQELTWDSSG